MLEGFVDGFCDDEADDTIVVNVGYKTDVEDDSVDESCQLLRS